MLDKNDTVLNSGGASGAEAEFGRQAEKFGIVEVNFSFEGHETVRTRGVRLLSREELKKGDVSLDYVSRLMNRGYTDSINFRKILQSIWYQVNSSWQVFVVGEILPDRTVKGGTGWGAELAKLFNKELFVFDQPRDGWFCWNHGEWVPTEKPVIAENSFCGTGTRFLEDNGRRAIAELFERSFK